MITSLRWMFFLGAITLVGCIPDPLEVKNVPDIKPRIVVSTQYVPGQALVVLLTKSFGALENVNEDSVNALVEQIAVTDAVVLVKGPASLDTLIDLGTGLYGGVTIPFQTNEWYELIVESEEYGKVNALTQVREQVDFESLQALRSPAGTDDTLVQVTYRAIDPPGKNNYVINVQRFRANDVLQNIIDPQTFMKLKDDAGFDGTEFGETFRAFPSNFRKGDTVAISLANISPEYYRFLKLREDNRFNLVEFLGEPINYPSNVQGGLGYFNLFVPSVRVVILE